MSFLSKPCFLLTLEPASHLTTYVYIRTKYHPMNLVWLSKVYTDGMRMALNIMILKISLMQEHLRRQMRPAFAPSLAHCSAHQL